MFLVTVSVRRKFAHCDIILVGGCGCGCDSFVICGILCTYWKVELCTLLPTRPPRSQGYESVRGVGEDGDGDGDGGVRGGESLCKGMCVVTPGTGMVVVTGLLPSSHVNRLWRRRWLVLWGEGLKVRPEERFKSGLGRSTEH